VGCSLSVRTWTDADDRFLLTRTWVEQDENGLRLRAEKADVVRDVALQRFPNLFSCETPFSRSLKVCLWNLATENVLARKANHQEPTTNDCKFVGDHTAGVHPFPSRTRKLSPAGPIVLHAKVCGRVGHRRHKKQRPRSEMSVAFLFFGEEVNHFRY
jgi:hypothetical protein